MEEINLKELFDYFKERIMLYIIIILSVLVVGSFYSILLKTPLYRSSSKLLFIEGNAKSTLTYKEVVTSQKVLDPVIDELQLDYSTNALKKNIDVTTTDNTNTIVITVDDKDRNQAVDIANEVTKLFKKEMKDMYGITKIEDLDVPKVANSPYNVNIVKDLVIYATIGLILGAAIIFAIYYFDTRIKSAEEVEKKFNLPTFGIVPKVESKEK